eukprot:g78456.t1
MFVVLFVSYACSYLSVSQRATARPRANPRMKPVAKQLVRVGSKAQRGPPTPAWASKLKVMPSLGDWATSFKQTGPLLKLKKRGEGLWAPCIFALDEEKACILYAPNNGAAAMRAVKSIPLQTATLYFARSVEIPWLEEQKFCFEICTPARRNYILAAANQADFRAWVMGVARLVQSIRLPPSGVATFPPSPPPFLRKSRTTTVTGGGEELMDFAPFTFGVHGFLSFSSTVGAPMQSGYARIEGRCSLDGRYKTLALYASPLEKLPLHEIQLAAEAGLTISEQAPGSIFLLRSIDDQSVHWMLQAPCKDNYTQWVATLQFCVAAHPRQASLSSSANSSRFFPPFQPSSNNNMPPSHAEQSTNQATSLPNLHQSNHLAQDGNGNKNNPGEDLSEDFLANNGKSSNNAKRDNEKEKISKSGRLSARFLSPRLGKPASSQRLEENLIHEAETDKENTPTTGHGAERPVHYHKQQGSPNITPVTSKIINKITTVHALTADFIPPPPPLPPISSSSPNKDASLDVSSNEQGAHSSMKLPTSRQAHAGSMALLSPQQAKASSRHTTHSSGHASRSTSPVSNNPRNLKHQHVQPTLTISAEPLAFSASKNTSQTNAKSPSVSAGSQQAARSNQSTPLSSRKLMDESEADFSYSGSTSRKKTKGLASSNSAVLQSGKPLRLPPPLGASGRGERLSFSPQASATRLAASPSEAPPSSAAAIGSCSPLSCPLSTDTESVTAPDSPVPPPPPRTVHDSPVPPPPRPASSSVLSPPDSPIPPPPPPMDENFASPAAIIPNSPPPPPVASPASASVSSPASAPSSTTKQRAAASSRRSLSSANANATPASNRPGSSSSSSRKKKRAKSLQPASLLPSVSSAASPPPLPTDVAVPDIPAIPAATTAASTPPPQLPPRRVRPGSSAAHLVAHLRKDAAAAPAVPAVETETAPPATAAAEKITLLSPVLPTKGQRHLHVSSSTLSRPVKVLPPAVLPSSSQLSSTTALSSDDFSPQPTIFKGFQKAGKLSPEFPEADTAVDLPAPAGSTSLLTYIPSGGSLESTASQQSSMERNPKSSCRTDLSIKTAVSAHSASTSPVVSSREERSLTTDSLPPPPMEDEDKNDSNKTKALQTESQQTKDTSSQEGTTEQQKMITEDDFANDRPETREERLARMVRAQFDKERALKQKQAKEKQVQQALQQERLSQVLAERLEKERLGLLEKALREQLEKERIAKELQSKEKDAAQLDDDVKQIEKLIKQHFEAERQRHLELEKSLREQQQQRKEQVQKEVQRSQETKVFETAFMNKEAQAKDSSDQSKAANPRNTAEANNEKEEKQMCEECEEMKVLSTYCTDCETTMCDACDVQLHRKKGRARHRRTKVLLTLTSGNISAEGDSAETSGGRLAAADTVAVVTQLDDDFVTTTRPRSYMLEPPPLPPSELSLHRSAEITQPLSTSDSEHTLEQASATSQVELPAADRELHRKVTQREDQFKAKAKDQLQVMRLERFDSTDALMVFNGEDGAKMEDQEDGAKMEDQEEGAIVSDELFTHMGGPPTFTQRRAA